MLANHQQPNSSSSTSNTSGSAAPSTASAGSSEGASAGNAAYAEATCIVQSGDTLSAIAKAYTGETGHYPELFDHNTERLTNPNVLRVGQELKIPPAWAPQTAPTASENDTPRPEQTALPTEVPAGEPDIPAQLLQAGEDAWRPRRPPKAPHPRRTSWQSRPPPRL